MYLRLFTERLMHGCFYFQVVAEKTCHLIAQLFFFFLFFSFFHCFCIRFSLGVAHGSVASNLDSNKTFSFIYVARVVHVFCFFFYFCVCVCLFLLPMFTPISCILMIVCSSFLFVCFFLRF